MASMRRLMQILFWSVISAAFIGPGTLTTAASAGSRYGFALLWALLFSTVACVVLQEASARVTVASGKPLATAIRQQFADRAAGVWVVFLVLGAIVLGCAAYEAGNILGSVAGAGLQTSIPPRLFTIVIGLISGALLYFGTTRTIARVLGVVVALMGATFLVTAALVGPSLGNLIRGMFVPSLPAGSSLLVLGLIGTTVVPYNLFLGSAVAAGQKLGEVRFGLTIAIVFGGVISMGVLVVGTVVAGEFGFAALADALASQLGGWAGVFFAFGLFAAGISSAITAPLAAAITAKGLFDTDDGTRWSERSPRFRAVWLGVLTVGVFFGLIDIRPIPAIIVAQALNGVLLPFVAVFLFIVVNDRRLMGDRAINGALANILMGLVVAVTIVLGVFKSTQAITSAFDWARVDDRTLLSISALVTAVLALPIARDVRKRRSAS